MSSTFYSPSTQLCLLHSILPALSYVFYILLSQHSAMSSTFYSPSTQLCLLHSILPVLSYVFYILFSQHSAMSSTFYSPNTQLCLLHSILPTLSYVFYIIFSQHSAMICQYPKFLDSVPHPLPAIIHGTLHYTPPCFPCYCITLKSCSCWHCLVIWFVT